MQVVRNRCAGFVSLQTIVKLGSGRLSLVCFARSYAVAGCFNNMYFVFLFSAAKCTFAHQRSFGQTLNFGDLADGLRSWPLLASRSRPILT